MISAASLPSCGSLQGPCTVVVHPVEYLHSAHRLRWHFEGYSVSSAFACFSQPSQWSQSITAVLCGCSFSCDVLQSAHLCFCFSGVPVSSRVSAKIQQLVNTLKRPKRPPLREFFVDDFEELLEGKRTLSHPHLFHCPYGTINYNDIFSTKVFYFLRAVISPRSVEDRSLI